MVFSYNLLKIKKGKVSFLISLHRLSTKAFKCVSVERFHSVVPVGNFWILRFLPLRLRFSYGPSIAQYKLLSHLKFKSALIK